jgi:hypothetical protein
MSKKKEEQFLTVAQYAAKNKKTTTWVYDQIKAGKVKCIQVGKIKLIEL